MYDNLSHRHPALVGFLLASLVTLASATYVFFAERGNDIQIAEAASERRAQIITAGELAVSLSCADTNEIRRESRRTILDGRKRLRALALEGSITQGLYREAVRQGDKRLLRLDPADCGARVLLFRRAALSGVGALPYGHEIPKRRG